MWCIMSNQDKSTYLELDVDRSLALAPVAYTAHAATEATHHATTLIGGTAVVATIVALRLLAGTIAVGRAIGPVAAVGQEVWRVIGRAGISHSVGTLQTTTK